MKHMSDEEIIMRYREAKDKRAQVNILAELNACDPDEIVSVLRMSGMEYKCLPRAPRKNKDKKEKKPKYFKQNNKQKEEKVMENAEFTKITPEEVYEDGSEKAVGALTVQIARVQQENEGLQKEIEDLKNKYNSALDANVLDSKRIQELEAELKDSREAADTLSKIAEEQGKEIAVFNEEYDKLRAENDKLSVELHETEKELAAAQEQIETIKESTRPVDLDGECEKEINGLCRAVEARDEYIAELEKAIVSRFLKEN